MTLLHLLEELNRLSQEYLQSHVIMNTPEEDFNIMDIEIVTCHGTGSFVFLVSNEVQH